MTPSTDELWSDLAEYAYLGAGHVLARMVGLALHLRPEPVLRDARRELARDALLAVLAATDKKGTP